MRKIIKIIGIIILATVILLAALLVKVFIDQKRQAEDQKAMIKTDAELLGVRFQVPRRQLMKSTLESRIIPIWTSSSAMRWGWEERRFARNMFDLGWP